jgi:3-dehydroquinate synthase
MIPSKVEFLKKLPSAARLGESLDEKPEKYLIIYDSRLRKNDTVAKWLKDFRYTYPVSAGEKLKDLDKLSSHIQSIFKMVSPFSPKSLCLVAVGGGTVGDFVGFLASILKRGVPFIQIPSTLLAAIDSAHGGKTALNVGSFKNQIGSFYPANSVMIVRSLFDELPATQIQSGSGELAKIGLIQGGEFFERLKAAYKSEMDSLWEFLPEAIANKYKVVERDPYERSGERQVLNLGHSLGHALETYFEIPHGVAVGQGLVFAINWSQHQGFLPAVKAKEALDFLIEGVGFLPPKEFARAHKSMSRSKLHKIISEDKKLTDTRHFTFIFLEDIGKPYRKVVTLESFLTETQRQGWTSV